MVFKGRGFTLEGNTIGLHSVQLCTGKESLPLVQEGKKATSLKVKGPLYRCLLITCLPSRSRTLNQHL